jgi:hypothetical protein
MGSLSSTDGSEEKSLCTVMVGNLTETDHLRGVARMILIKLILQKEDWRRCIGFMCLR